MHAVQESVMKLLHNNLMHAAVLWICLVQIFKMAPLDCYWAHEVPPRDPDITVARSIACHIIEVYSP